MRTFLSFVALTALSLSATSAFAQRYRDTTGDAINPEKAINQSTTNTDIQLGVEQGITVGTHQTPNGVPVQQGNHWRYRFQNSQWWYYQPNNQWVVWNGSRWVQPSTMTANSTQPQQHQSGYRGTQGINQAAQQAARAQQVPTQATQPQRTMRSASPTIPSTQNANPMERQPKGMQKQPEGNSVGNGTSTLPGTPARDTTTPSGSVQ